MAADRTSDRPTPGEPVAGLDPDDIGRKTFETGFRGYEPGEVQAYLLTVASELRSTRERTFDLELRLGEAERAAEQAAVIDDARLTSALGDEVATILEAARSAAAKMRAQAEIDAGALVRAGEEQAVRLRREADELLAVRTAEARQAASVIEQEAEALRVQATIDAAAQVEAGKQAGREMVAEAQVVRERILKDLSRRRRQARQQIEQLRAGRERLLEAYRVVRETMERATEELEISLPAAKAAAETAGRSLPDDDDLSIEQLEGMLDAARDAGLIDARAAEVEAEIEADIEAEPATVTRIAEGAGAAEGQTADEAEADTAEPAAEVAEAPGPAAPPVRSHRRSRRAERIVADEPAPAPIEGRRSSSVRVFRRDGDGPVTGEVEAVADGAPVDEAAVGADEELVVEVVEEIVEVDELPDGDVEVVVIEEVVEMVVEPDTPDAPTDSPAEGEVITGLFARIRADHAEPSTPDAPAVTDAAKRGRTKPKRKANGNGNGHGQAPKAPKATGPTPAADPAPAEPTDDESPQDRRDRALAGPSRGLGRALKRVVADEQNEVLDVVRREKKTPELEGVLPEAADHALRYAAAARGELADAAYAGATFADEATAERPEIDDLAAELSLAIVNQLRGGFARSLASAPDDREALLDDLRAVYRVAKGQRVDECVHHFAGEAFNRGVRAASTSGLDQRMLVDAGTKPSLA